MIVDPNTGQIIAMSSTASAMPGDMHPSSITGAAGIAGMNQLGIGGQTSMEMLAHLPAASATMGWNATRGTRTIFKGEAGAWGRRARSMAGMGQKVHNQSIWNSLRYTFNPRYAGRLRYDALGGHGRSIAGYTPFNFLAPTANRAADRGLGRLATEYVRNGTMLGADDITPNMAKNLVERRGNLAARFSNFENKGLIKSGSFNPATGHFAGLDDEAMFSRGSYARLSAMSKVQRGRKLVNSKGNLTRSGRSVAKFLDATDAFNTVLPSGTPYSYSSKSLAAHSDASAFIGASGRGTASQFVSGYFHGARRGSTLSEPAADFLRQTARNRGFSESAFLAGRSSAASHLALGGIQAGEKLTFSAFRSGLSTAYAAGGKGAAARFAGAGAARGIGMAIPGVNIAMTAWMVSDLMQMGIAGIRGMAEFGKDAMFSARGQIGKPVMGMGYQDNTVAATSRARGVMAIQNSRLNARSVLGSEAGMLAGHFG